MNKFKKNVKLEYLQLGLRSFNVTNGIWLLFLLVKGFNPLEIGVFESVFHIASMALEVPSGMLADLIGRKKARILGVFLYLVYVIVIVYSSNFALIILAFVLCGVSYSFESGSGEAMIYDSLKILNEEEKYMKVNGNREIIFQLSSTIALFIGGYLATLDYRLNFLVVFIAFVTALIPLMGMSETTVKVRKKRQKMHVLLYEHFVKSTKTVLSDKNLTFLILIGALFAAPVTSLFFYFQIYLSSSLNYSEILIGLLLGLHSFAGALGGYFSSKLESRFQEKLLLYVVPLVLVVTFWLIQVDSIVFIPFIVIGFLDSLLYIVISDYINRMIPSNQRATILSFSSFTFSLVMIAIFPILGAIANVYDLKISFFVLACLVLTMYILLMIYLKNNKFYIKED